MSIAITVLSIILGIGLILALSIGWLTLFVTSRDLEKNISDIHHMLKALDEKVYEIDSSIKFKSDMGLDSFPNPTSNPLMARGPLGMLFSTNDGKHFARSPEELIQKIKSDPEYDFDDDELNNIRQAMEDHKNKFLPGDVEEDDDDEFDGPESWKL